MTIETHVFSDRDVTLAQALGQNPIILEVVGNSTEYVELTKEDVKAMAKHFNLIPRDEE